MGEIILTVGLLIIGVVIGIFIAKIFQKQSERVLFLLNEFKTELISKLEQHKTTIQWELVSVFRREIDMLKDEIAKDFAQGRKEQNELLCANLNSLEQRFDSVKQALTQGLEAIQRVTSQSGGELLRTLNLQLETTRQATTRYLEEMRTTVERQLEAIRQTVQSRLDENLKEGFAHFQRIQEHLKAAERQLQQVNEVGQSIHELNRLLRLPHLRGKFGEAQLERLLTDFLPTHSYQLQYEIIPGSGEFVDAIVRFPGYILPIDSKFSREQIEAIFAAEESEQRELARKKLAQVIREQARQIARKYIHPEHGTTDLALMFLPSETLYFEVIQNPELYKSICELKVFPVSPNTLAVTLRAIGLSLRQYQISQQVREIMQRLEQASEALERFQERFEELGRGLGKVQLVYHHAAGQLEQYLGKVARFGGLFTGEQGIEQTR